MAVTDPPPYNGNYYNGYYYSPTHTYVPGYYWYPSHKSVKQGWECPKCERVYSPSMTMCSYCGNDKVTTGTDVKITWTNESGT